MVAWGAAVLTTALPDPLKVFLSKFMFTCYLAASGIMFILIDNGIIIKQSGKTDKTFAYLGVI